MQKGSARVNTHQVMIACIKNDTDRERKREKRERERRKKERGATPPHKVV